MTAEEAKKEIIKCDKDHFPSTIYDYDGAGGSRRYVRDDLVDLIAERYAQSELSEANKEIERLKAEIALFNKVRGKSYYFNKCNSQQQEIERLKEGLRKALKLITQSATESLRPEIQDYLSGGYAQYVQDAAFKDSLGIDSLITPK